MKTYELAMREIAAAHEKLGEPMKKEERELINMNILKTSLPSF